MKINFVPCDFLDVEEFVDEYEALLASPIDSFLEDHVMESQCFLIAMDTVHIGYFSVYDKELLTQFYIRKPYRALGQEIFFKVKKMKNIRCAFVSTGDEFFLSHALDEYRTMEKQAYFFQDAKDLIKEEKIDQTIHIRLAEKSDMKEIVEKSEGFYDNLEDSISNQEIYIATKSNKTVGFGIIENGSIMRNYASIGMYTVAEFRQQGIGRNILLMLKEVVYRNGMKPIAGCWYYNHESKKTLESAGMYTDTRLLKIHY